MRLKLFLLFFLLTVFAVPSFAFVLQMDRSGQGRIVTVRWPASEARQGVPFWVDAGSFPFSEQDVVRAVGRSFAAWEAVETAFIRFQDRGTGTFQISETDEKNVIYYDATGGEVGAPRGTGIVALTRGTGIVALTRVNWNERGEMVDADIVFNGRDNTFSLDQEDPRRRTVDLQDVLVHEIGHFLGLDHSALEGAPSVRATMYPFFFGEERSPESDDVAGATALYPSSDTARKVAPFLGR